MFDEQSRYEGLETATITRVDADGRERVVAYKRRRFVPAPEEFQTLVEHRVVQGDRIDVVTARYLGDPTQFWQVCDANGAMRPAELVDEIGATVRIPLPRL